MNILMKMKRYLSHVINLLELFRYVKIYRYCLILLYTENDVYWFDQ